MSRWTIEENAICFYELKSYLNYISSGPRSINREKFAQKVTNQYLIYRDRTAPALMSHLDFLYKAGLNRYDTLPRNHEIYRGILLTNNQTTIPNVIEEEAKRSSWTIAKNAVCFYELKDYIQLFHSKKKQSVINQDHYVQKLINQYPLLQHHTPSAVKQHLEYLYLVAIDEYANEDRIRENDQCYKGILLMNHSFESTGEIEVPELEDEKEQPEDKKEQNQQSAPEDPNEEPFCLSDEQIQSLLSFIGYGPLHKTTIAFLANEGGLGALSVGENINLLSNEYKKNKSNYLDGEDWRNGYWHMEEYNPEKESFVPNSPYLYLSARILLALENKGDSIDDWFKKGDINKLDKVKKFISNSGLYSDKPGIKSALLDWRPLPRRNENDKQFPYENINRRKYLQAFGFKGKSDNHPYNEWVDKRMDLFKNVLSKYEIPFLLSFGDVSSKLTLFKKIWPEIEFKEVILEESHKTIYVSKEKAGNHTTVLVAEFLDYQNLGYVGTMELVKYLKEHYMES